MEPSDIYFDTTLNEKISMSPSEVHINENIDSYLLNRINQKWGGKCNRNGLIKKDSINILSRTMGLIPPEHFNGDIHYRVKFSAKICNPNEGMDIICQVHNQNKMGIMAGIEGCPLDESPLTILISSQHHYDNAEFEQAAIGDRMLIEVIGTKYELNDTSIRVIGVLKKLLPKTIQKTTWRTNPNRKDASQLPSLAGEKEASCPTETGRRRGMENGTRERS